MVDSDVIINHVLVPKHEILPKTEKAAVLEKSGVTIDQMPKIKADDPVILAIGAKKGDLIKITRKSPTAGESAYYRVVH